jgi:hypothetical protein
MAKYLSCAETAKIIRKELKTNFPKIKFSVRSSVYSGGSSIRIQWVDGPSEKAVEKVAKPFRGATFDAYTDSKSYVAGEYEGEAVHFGSDYIFCTRAMSREFVMAITSQFCKRFGIPMLEISGSDQDAWPNTNFLDYSKEHWLNDLLHNTDAKDMYRAYAAEDERETREHAEWEAQKKAQAEREAKERAEAEAKAEQERIRREQAEFAQWQYEQLNNEQWQREQFRLWKLEKKRQEAERLAKEQAERERQQRERQEKMRREQEERERRQREQREYDRIRSSYRTTLSSKQSALVYLGLTTSASRSDVMKAFRNKVRAAADGKGGYNIDMDFLVKVKEKALQ